MESGLSLGLVFPQGGNDLGEMCSQPSQGSGGLDTESEGVSVLFCPVGVSLPPGRVR